MAQRQQAQNFSIDASPRQSGGESSGSAHERERHHHLKDLIFSDQNVVAVTEIWFYKVRRV